MAKPTIKTPDFSGAELLTAQTVATILEQNTSIQVQEKCTEKILLSVTASMKDRLKLIAEQKNCTVNSLIRAILEQAL